MFCREQTTMSSDERKILDIQEEDGISWIVPLKNLDFEYADELKEQVMSYIEQGHERLAFDLSKSEFIDSMGLGVLMIAYAEIRNRAGGRLALFGASDEVSEVLRLTALKGQGILFNTRSEAEQYMRHGNLN
jgi:anti-sigma B factor antagonist